MTTAKDTPLNIDALANDLDANQPGFAPVIGGGPANGQLVVNPDGSSDYTPDQDWSGDDSFGYLLSDESVDSNTSTVSVSVTPVNDAPVGEDNSVVTLENTS